MKIFEGKDWVIIEKDGRLAMNITHEGLLSMTDSFGKLTPNHVTKFLTDNRDLSITELITKLEAYQQVQVTGNGWIYTRNNTKAELVHNKNKKKYVITILDKTDRYGWLDDFIWCLNTRYFDTVIKALVKRYPTVIKLERID